jgi:hypothetical protein
MRSPAGTTEQTFSGGSESVAEEARAFTYEVLREETA